MQKNSRILGERTGDLHGPLLIIFGEIHGNEPAGRLAVEELFEAIDLEYVKKPGFTFKGKILALRGNVRAAAQGKRFIKRDLNRSWTQENVQRIFAAKSDEELDAEDLEIKENLELIRSEIKAYNPTRVVVLDVHTTTADGGIFSIPAVDEESRRIALNMHAPVLHGFLDGLEGTSLHYFKTENFDVDMTAVCFEAGQHNHEDSYKHAISAIINCHRSIGGFDANDIETKHDELLKARSAGLPVEGELLYVHAIREGDEFRMRADKTYLNFDPIVQDELLAEDRNGKIHAPFGGRILMPLYQKQGEDGFFIIKDLA